MITKPVPFLCNFSDNFRMMFCISAKAEKCGFGLILLQNFQRTISYFGCRPIIKCQINDLVIT